MEGDNHNSDWWQFEQRGGILTGDSADPACDHYARYAEDFRILRRLNNNAHRLSVEWARVEPRPGEFDSRQVRHYRDVLAELREQGMLPMVTLHHFSSPIWFAERGGWAASGAPDAWLPFVRLLADELGDLVGFWCTVNEPNIYAVQGWLMGEFPPGRRHDLRGAYRALANLRLAHEAAYAVLKRRTPEVPVGLAHHKMLMLPERARHPLDVAAAAAAQGLMDRWPAGGRMVRVLEAPADYVGLNHYTGQLVRFDPRRPGDGFARRSNPPGLPESDFGWAIEPDWLRRSLLELGARGLPLYVTENGVAAADDSRRERFLIDALGAVWDARQAGADVRGYFHWTSTDNFEWARGYSMRFGLVGVDPKTQERTVKPSGRLFARIAGANALPAG